LVAARAIPGQQNRAKALLSLAPLLSDAERVALLTQPLNAADAIRNEGERARTASDFAPLLRFPYALLDQALDVAKAIGDERHRAQAVAALAPHLTRALLSDALNIAKAIGDEEHRAQALAALAPHLSEA
jgi:hypothetical protein